MEVNGVLLDIDFTDADTLQRIEDGSKKIYEEADKIKNTATTPAEGIRQECKILKDFLDYVFEDSISEKVFGDKNSLRDCLKAYEDIIKERNRQVDNLQNVVDTYSPQRIER